MDDLRQKPLNQGKAQKRSVQKTTEPLSQRPPWAARGVNRGLCWWMHGRAAWDPRPRVPPTPGCFGFLHGCSIFWWFCAIKARHSQPWRSPFHSTTILIHME